jgi:hypothetical protein
MDVNLHEFQEFLKLLAFQAGAVALELRGKVSDLGKDIVGPDGRRNDERSRARRAMTVVDLAIQELVLTGILEALPGNHVGSGGGTNQYRKNPQR